MSQNRDAPAYQEYAATILAQLPFRTMTLQDRGLLYTMKLECWVNVRLPHSHSDLAKVLGLPVAEVAGSLAAVMPFFEVVDGFIISPELENYRAHLAAIRDAKINGGKRGAAVTNRKRNNPAKPVDTDATGMPSGMLQLTRRVKSGSSVKSNPVKQNQNQSLEKEVTHDPWVAEYEAHDDCTAAAYAKASGGG